MSIVPRSVCLFREMAMMAVSRFTDFCRSHKVLTAWGVLLLLGFLTVDVVVISSASIPPASTSAAAHAEPAALTPAMQKCLSRNADEAGYAMVVAQVRAERHVGEDIGKARAAAWVEALKLKCDLRPHEVWAARDYLIAEEKRGH
jgi:hypothetical protein